MRNRVAVVLAVCLASSATACGSESDGSPPSGSTDAATDSSTGSLDSTTGADSASAMDSDVGGADAITDATVDSAVSEVGDAGIDASRETSVLAAEDASTDGPLPPAPGGDFYSNFFIHDGTLYWCGLPHDFHTPTQTLHSLPATGGVVTDVVSDLAGPGPFAVVGDYVYFLDHPASSSDEVLVRVQLGVGATTTETVATYTHTFTTGFLAMAPSKNDLYLSGDALVSYLPLPISTGATPTTAFTEGFAIRDLAFTDTEVLWLGDGEVHAGPLESSSGLRRVGSSSAYSFDGSFHVSGANAYWVTRDADLVSVPIAGSGATAKTIVHLPGASGTTGWDGDVLYYTTTAGIMRVDTSGAAPTSFVSGSGGSFAFDAANVYWMRALGIYKAPK